MPRDGYGTFHFISGVVEWNPCEAGYSVLCRDFMRHCCYDRKTV